MCAPPRRKMGCPAKKRPCPASLEKRLGWGTWLAPPRPTPWKLENLRSGESWYQSIEIWNPTHFHVNQWMWMFSPSQNGLRPPGSSFVPLFDDHWPSPSAKDTPVNSLSENQQIFTFAPPPLSGFLPRPAHPLLLILTWITTWPKIEEIHLWGSRTLWPPTGRKVW